MEIEIDDGRGDVLDRGKALVEVARRDEPLQQFFGHRLAGPVMEREAPQDVGLLEPVFVELRGQLDEIGRDVGAGDLRIGHRGEQAVQRVAELVEQGAGVVEAQQRRLAVGGLGKIHHVDDERADVAGELFLIAQSGHPGAAALRCAREIIAEEQPDLSAVTRRAPPRPARRGARPARPCAARSQAEQALRRIERGLDHPVELQVRLDRGLVEVAAPLAQFFRIIAPVPGRQREIAALLRDQRLQSVAVGERFLPRARPDRIEQVAHRGRRLRHGVVEPVMGEVGISRAAGRARRAAAPSRR